jgi:integrase/recombinase XerD
MKTNAAYVNGFLTHLQGVRNPNTTYEYRQVLAHLTRWVSRSWADLEPTEIDSFLMRPRRNGGVAAPATRSRELSAIKSFYKWMVTNGHCNRNVAELVARPTVKNENPRPVPDHLWAQVWQSDLSVPERLTLGLGYFGGLRRMEIAHLQSQHVLPDGTLAHFPRKGGGDDVLPLPMVATAMQRRLPALAVGSSEFLELLVQTSIDRAGMGPLVDIGGNPNGRRTMTLPNGINDPLAVNRTVRRIVEREGLNPHAFTPHAMRHSFVTNLLRCGIPLHLVSKLANHSQVSTTMRYAKVAGVDLAAWLEVDEISQVSRHRV